MPDTPQADAPPTEPESGDIEALLRQMAAAPAIDPSPELFPLKPGALIGDTYRIEERIGAGGMGVVYRATDVKLGRRVALKLHRRAPDPDRFDRLMREASLMAGLSHPNVLTVFEVGHYEDPREAQRLFVAMEYVDGGSVVEWARARPRSWRAILEVFAQAGDGLVAAHAAGMIHRDFKPANVLIDKTGRVRVADFGLARQGPERGAPPVSDPAPATDDSETQEGAIIGTPAYMAPEQWRGEVGTSASDQFALCVSLFEVLYGSNPLAEQRGADRSTEPRWEPPPGRHRVPARILRTLQRGLATEPNRRFASVAELLVALRRDPWRLPVRAGALIAAVGIGSALGLGLNHSTPDTCDASAALTSGWNADVRQEVVDALSADDERYAATTATTVIELLTAHAAAWVEESNAACHASVQGVDVAAQRACLRSDRRRFESLVRALTKVDAKGRERAVLAVADLPSPSACATATAPDVSEADAEARSDLEAKLAGVEAAVALQQDEIAREDLDTLRPALDALDQADLQARLELLEGRLLRAHEDSTLGIAALDRALAAAMHARQPRILARVAADLSLALSQAERPDEADRALLIASAATDERELPVRIRLTLASARIASLEGREHYKQAAEVAGTGVALAEAELGDDHPITARMLDNLGVPLGHLQRYAEALEANARAAEITTRTRGADHPAMARLELSRGVLLFSSGDSGGAVEALRESVRLYRQHAGPAAPPTVNAASNLSSALLSRASDRGSDEGELDEAEALLAPIGAQLVEEGRARAKGNELLFQNLGQIMFKRGRHAEGIESMNLALSSIESVYGPESIRLGPGLSQLASGLLSLGRHDEARATLERALTIATAAKTDPANVARLYLLMGMIERAAGRPDAARTALETGRELARGSNATVLVERADKVLAELD